MIYSRCSFDLVMDGGSRPEFAAIGCVFTFYYISRVNFAMIIFRVVGSEEERLKLLGRSSRVV